MSERSTGEAGERAPTPPTGASGARRPTFTEQARRRQIVDAAIETMAELGYRNTTFARIAARAGCSPALISYHFASKAELMRQVVVTISEAMDAAIMREVSEVPTYRAALRGVIETQVRYFAEHTTEVLALGHIMRQGSDDELSASLDEDRARTIAELETLFAEGQAAEELRSFPTRPMAISLLAALEAVPPELLSRPDIDADEYARALADLFDAAVARSE